MAGREGAENRSERGERFGGRGDGERVVAGTGERGEDREFADVSSRAGKRPEENECRGESACRNRGFEGGNGERGRERENIGGTEG